MEIDTVMKFVENPIVVVPDAVVRITEMQEDLRCAAKLYRDRAILTFKRTEKNIRNIMVAGCDFYCSDADLEAEEVNIEVGYTEIIDFITDRDKLDEFDRLDGEAETE